MFQICGNGCNFNSFSKVTTFWLACFLLPPNPACPTGIAFPIFGFESHSSDWSQSLFPSATSCCSYHRSRVKMGSRAEAGLWWDEVSKQKPPQQRPQSTEANTAQSILLFKAALISVFILTSDQMCDGKVVSPESAGVFQLIILVLPSTALLSHIQKNEWMLMLLCVSWMGNLK